MNILPYKAKIHTCARYLLTKQSPKDGGWGLNIEHNFQASSIVNTAEAALVIRAAGISWPDRDRAIHFLRTAMIHHPKDREPNLRYLTFGVWGLIEAGCSLTDADVLSATSEIERRFNGNGWSEHPSDAAIRLLSTFQSLWTLMQVKGADYVATRYRPVFDGFLSIGRESGFKWSLADEADYSLSATSYIALLLTHCYPGSTEATEIRNSLVRFIHQSLIDRKLVDVEAIPGTDWHHYSYCWALKALCSYSVMDEPSFWAATQLLEFINSLYAEGRGFMEPGKTICNVRSTFNSVLGIDSVIQSFDPSQYDLLARVIRRSSPQVLPRSIFLSFSFNSKDKALINGLKDLLEQKGYTVVTGESNPVGSLSKGVLRKIRQCERCIVVMTCRDKKSKGVFTTSSWLIEEKGAAIAMDKPCVILVEQGVDDKEIGGLQGDDQRVRFTRIGFTSAVAQVLKMLEDAS